MTTFPALIPSSRAFTPGEYPATAFAGYSGAQNRVRHSNVFLAAQLRLTFLGLNEAQMLDIWNHYNGRRGEFRSFALPAEVVSYGSITDYVPGNYLWRYAGPGSVEDLPCGGHNVSLTLETAPPVAASVVGADLFLRLRLRAGAADSGEYAPGISEAITLSVAGGAALVALNGIDQVIGISISTEAAVGDAEVSGISGALYLGFAIGGAANTGALGINETISLNLVAGAADDGNEGPWNPADIATALWLDASDTTTITESSGAVSQWDDKSGNARHASQSSSNSRPAISAAAQNSLDALSFDGSNDFFSLASALPSASSGSFDVFFAGKPNNSGRVNLYGGAGIVRQYPGSDAAGSWAVGVRDNGAVAAQHHLTSGSNSNGAVFGGSISTNTNAIAFWRYDTDGGATSQDRWEIRVNGGAPVSTSTSGTDFGWGTGSGEIGRSWTGFGFYFQGLMYEIVITAAKLSTADRQKAEGYLAHKWGLTANLPGDHPYKSAPP